MNSPIVVALAVVALVLAVVALVTQRNFAVLLAVSVVLVTIGLAVIAYG